MNVKGRSYHSQRKQGGPRSKKADDVKESCCFRLRKLYLGGIRRDWIGGYARGCSWIEAREGGQITLCRTKSNIRAVGGMSNVQIAFLLPLHIAPRFAHSPASANHQKPSSETADLEAVGIARRRKALSKALGRSEGSLDETAISGHAATGTEQRGEKTVKRRQASKVATRGTKPAGADCAAFQASSRRGRACTGWSQSISGRASHLGRPHTPWED